MLSFFCSEEGNQAHAKHVFGFTRTYNEKIRKREARLTAKLAGFSSLKKEENTEFKQRIKNIPSGG